MPESRGAAYVLQKAEERHIGLIELWVLDTRGHLHVQTIMRQELDAILEFGLPIASSRIARVSGRDWLLLADPLTYATLPRSGHEDVVARLLGDLQTADGAPVPFCARTILKRQLGRAKALGYNAYVSAAVDSRMVQAAASVARSERRAEAFDARLRPQHERALAREAALRAEALGIGLTSFAADSDAGAWTYELSAVDPLTLADAIVSLRRVVSDTAASADARATFMPRPWPGARRGSLNLTFALVEGADSGHSVADLDRRTASGGDAEFAARVARDLRAIELVGRPTINGRHTPGAMSAKAVFSPDGTPATRIAGADANANPYLLLALTLGAALDATTEIERDVDPDSGLSALAHAAQSALLRDVLGPELLADLVACAEADDAAWRAQVTPFELESDRI